MCLRVGQAKKSKAGKGKDQEGSPEKAKFANPMDDDDGLSDEDAEGDEQARMCVLSHSNLAIMQKTMLGCEVVNHFTNCCPCLCEPLRVPLSAWMCGCVCVCGL